MPAGLWLSRRVNLQRNATAQHDRSAWRQEHTLQLEDFLRRMAARFHEVDREINQQVLRFPRLAAQREAHGHLPADRHSLRREAHILDRHGLRAGGDLS